MFLSLTRLDPGTPDASPLPPGVTSKEMMAAMEDIWLDNADLDDEPISPLTEHKHFVRDDPRRHSIGVCQSQRRSVMKKSKSTTPTVSYDMLRNGGGVVVVRCDGGQPFNILVCSDLYYEISKVYVMAMAFLL